MRLDLLSSNGARPPSRCLLCDRFLVGRFIVEGLTMPARERVEFGVDEVEEVEVRFCHGSLALCNC